MLACAKALLTYIEIFTFEAMIPDIQDGLSFTNITFIIFKGILLLVLDINIQVFFILMTEIRLTSSYLHKL